MDQIYLERPEHRPAPILCSKGCKRSPAPGRKCCAKCLATARKGYRAHRAQRNEWLRNKRAAAREAGKCTNCFKRDASAGRAWCEPCRERNALSYRNASPEQKIRRASINQKYWQKNKKRIRKRASTLEGRAAACRHKQDGKLAAIAKEKARKSGERVHVVLARMGAEAKMVERWKRREERGYVR